MRGKTLIRVVNQAAMASLGAAALLFLAHLLESALWAQSATTVVGKYNGPGGCASSSCHGSIQPKSITHVNQNEYSIWAGQDKHARAFQVLSNPTSLRIGKILNLGAPNQAPKCLACHALSVPPEQRAESFELNDGVSCESCHGPASGWLGPHTTRDWPHQKSVQELGMYDTRDLVKRSERCLSCHLGTADKFVDHEMIAAGHPDLTFELNLFSTVMPRHWKPNSDHEHDAAQEWAIGEAVQLQKSLERLSRRASSATWPEYSELDCFACHHSLTRPEDSWRQESGYSGRKAGVAPWNEARYAVFRAAAKATDPNASQSLDASVMKLAALLGQLNGNREEIAATSKEAAILVGEMATRLNATPYDAEFSLRVMRSIAADGNAISLHGQRAAEQAAMSLDSLWLANRHDSGGAGASPENNPVAGAIKDLYAQLDNPSAYSAPRFAAQMQKVSDLLSREGLTRKAAR